MAWGNGGMHGVQGTFHGDDAEGSSDPGTDFFGGGDVTGDEVDPVAVGAALAAAVTAGSTPGPNLAASQGAATSGSNLEKIGLGLGKFYSDILHLEPNTGGLGHPSQTSKSNLEKIGLGLGKFYSDILHLEPTAQTPNVLAPMIPVSNEDAEAMIEEAAVKSGVLGPNSIDKAVEAATDKVTSNYTHDVHGVKESSPAYTSPIQDKSAASKAGANVGEVFYDFVTNTVPVLNLLTALGVVPSFEDAQKMQFSHQGGTHGFQKSWWQGDSGAPADTWYGYDQGDPGIWGWWNGYPVGNPARDWTPGEGGPATHDLGDQGHTEPPCGEGFHEENGVCVPDTTKPKNDTGGGGGYVSTYKPSKVGWAPPINWYGGRPEWAKNMWNKPPGWVDYLNNYHNWG